MALFHWWSWCFSGGTEALWVCYGTKGLSGPGREPHCVLEASQRPTCERKYTWQTHAHTHAQAVDLQCRRQDISTMTNDGKAMATPSTSTFHSNTRNEHHRSLYPWIPHSRADLKQDPQPSIWNHSSPLLSTVENHQHQKDRKNFYLNTYRSDDKRCWI